MANPEKLLAKAQAALDEFHKEMKRDIGVPDLGGFELTVKELCTVVTTLPKDEAKKYEAALAVLAQELGELTQKLESKRDKIKGNIEGLDYNKKAQIAYRTAGHLSQKED